MMRWNVVWWHAVMLKGRQYVASDEQANRRSLVRRSGLMAQCEEEAYKKRTASLCSYLKKSIVALTVKAKSKH